MYRLSLLFDVRDVDLCGSRNLLLDGGPGPREGAILRIAMARDYTTLGV